MRIGYFVGTWRDKCYSDGVIDTRLTPTPSIWATVLNFCKYNSDRAFFYIIAVRTGTPKPPEFLPLKDINGVLVILTARVTSYATVWADGASELAGVFSYRRTTMPIDVIIATDNKGNYSIKSSLGCKNRPLIVNRTCDGLYERGGRLYHNPDKENYIDNIMFPLADLILTTGIHMKDGILQIMKEDLSFSLIKNTAQKMKYVPHGVPIYEGELNFNRGRVIGYFGRFTEPDKKTFTCFDIYDKAYRMGYVDRVIVTSSKKTDGDSPKLKEYSYIEFSAEKQDYVLKAQQARTSITYYTAISCPLGMLELMAYGVIPIAPKDKFWARKFFEKEFPDYPFLFENHNEILGMIKLIMDNDDLYQYWAKKMSKYVRENYYIKNTKRKMYDLIVEAREEQVAKEEKILTLDEYRKKYKFFPRIEKIADELGNEIKFDEFLKKVRNEGIPLVSQYGTHYADHKDLFRMLQALGYKDTLNTAIPVLRR